MVITYASSESLFFKNRKNPSIARVEDTLPLHTRRNGFLQIIW